MFESLFSLMFECRIRPKRTTLYLSLFSFIPDIYENKCWQNFMSVKKLASSA